MKTILIGLISLSCTLMCAQKPITWIGGTPGKETNWNESKNWSNHKVPNEDSFVIIRQQNTGHNAQPVIKEEVIVTSIEMHQGSKLIIEENGKLIIDGSFIYSEGISFFGGNVLNKGVLKLESLAVEITDQYFKNMENLGAIYIDGQLMDAKVEEEKDQIAKIDKTYAYIINARNSTRTLLNLALSFPFLK